MALMYFLQPEKAAAAAEFHPNTRFLPRFLAAAGPTGNAFH